MKSFLLQIHVKDDQLDTAVSALAKLKTQGRRDIGCITSAWMQHENEPRHFTLFEQWESQQALDTRLSESLTSELNELASYLEGPPQSTLLRSVTALHCPLTEGEVRQMAETWFQLLSRHAPVDELEVYLNPNRLWIRFPEQTITSLIDFYGWYNRVGELYRDQSHELQTLQLSRDSDTVGINLVVVWRATSVSDGSRLAVRVSQDWHVSRSLLTALPTIERYEVIAFDQLEP